MSAAERSSNRPRQLRPQRSASDPLARQAVWFIALAAGVVAAWTSDASPTGNSTIDRFEVGFAIFAVALAGSRARRWTLLVGSAVATILAPIPISIVSALGLFGTVRLFNATKRNRSAGAAIAGTIGVGAANLADFGLVTTVAAAIALLPVLASGYRRSNRKLRKRLLIVAGIGALAVGAVAALVGLSAIGLRADLEAAAGSTFDAADAARNGDDASATKQFRSAAAAFRDVTAKLDRPWMRMADFLPIASQNLRAVRTATFHGSRVTSAAAAATSELDYDSVQLAGGGVDASKLADLAPRALNLATSMGQAERAVIRSQNGLLVAPVSSKLEEMSDELGKLRKETETAALATELLPGILGTDFPRRYFIMFANPAESRDMGGLMASWAILRAEDGKLQIEETGSPIDLFGPVNNTIQLDGLTAYPNSLMEMAPTKWPQNWTSAFDLKVTSRMVADLMADAGKGQIDGVMYVDPQSLEALIGLTGPVSVPGTEIQLTGSNTASFFLVEQFVKLPQTPESDAALQQLVGDVFTKLTSTKLPGPRRLADTFGPLVSGGNLRFTTIRPQDDPLIERLDISGHVEIADGADVFGVLVRNVGPNKLDPYVDRTAAYRVRWDAVERSIAVSAQITFKNRATVAALPSVVTGNESGLPLGTAHMRVGVLSPYAEASFTIGGKPLVAVSVPEVVRRTDRGPTTAVYRHSFDLELPAGAEVTIDMDSGGKLMTRDYSLTLIGQPSGLGTDRIDATIKNRTGRMTAFHTIGGQIGTISQTEQ